MRHLRSHISVMREKNTAALERNSSRAGCLCRKFLPPLASGELFRQGNGDVLGFNPQVAAASKPLHTRRAIGEHGRLLRLADRLCEGLALAVQHRIGDVRTR